MNSTYTLNEGNDALNRVLLMMRYDLGKTLSENIVLEQKIPTDDDIKKYQRGEYENATRKYVDKTATSFIGPDGRQKTTATSPKMLKGIQRFDAPTISEVLLKTRELLFTPGGMTAQIILSVLGAEIGLPVAFQILDIAIIINDFSIMVKNWKKTNYTPWSWEWFEYQYNNNEGFALVLEDILILTTLGFGRLVGKGAKKAWNYFKPFSKKMPKMIESVEKEITKKTSYIEKLPKKISDYSKSKIDELIQGLNLLKSPKQAARSVVKQAPKAVVAGVLNYGFLIFFDKYILPKLTGGEEEITKLIPSVQENQDLIDYLVWNNPEYFPNGIKKIAIVSTNKKPGYFEIDGKTYEIINPKKYKLKQI
jgi:hypothetical protein